MLTTKRCIGFLLALVMVVGLLPQSILTVSAATLLSEMTAVAPNSEAVEPTVNIPEGLTYEVYEDHVKITYYSGEAAEVIIPAEIEGLPVTGIVDHAFYDCDNLSRVTIPDSVTTIGTSAFRSCSALSSVEIGNGVTIIGDYAFSGCSKLNDLTISDSVTTIGIYAFYLCGSLVDLVIPDGVTTIGTMAFASCTSLNSVTIGNNVTTIGSGAFQSCASLKSVTIGNSVNTMGSGAFSTCNSLEEIIFKGNAPYFDGSMFSFVTATAYYPAANPTWTEDVMQNYGGTITWVALDSEPIPTDLFYEVYDDHVEITGYTGNATELVIPAEIEGLPVTHIGNRFMQDCSSLTSILIPDTVTSIGWNAFWCCTSLTSISIPGSVTSIGASAFWGCSSLTSISIPDSVTSIGDSAFYECDSLTGIHVDENNPNYSSDDRGVLFNKEKTTLIQAPGGIADSYTIPESVSYIYDSAFAHCNSLISIGIPDSVTSIYSRTFYYCSSLTNVFIPDSVTEISSSAFYGCTSLTSISIPASVRSIENYAFEDCSSLASIYFNGDAPAFAEDVFGDVTATAYYPANNTTWTYEVMQDYGGDITWNVDIELGDLIGLEIVSTPAGGFVGKNPDFSGLRVELVYANDVCITADNAQLTISEIDTSTAGKKTVTVSYGGFSDEFTYLVHEGSSIVLDPSLYPESAHNYENDLDEIQILTWPSATGLVLVFSEQTYVEGSYDRIYVYDGKDSLVASYSGSAASGVTLVVHGDTVKIRITSDYSNTYYGYSFASISTMDTVVHTGTEILPAVEATCTEPGRTEGVVCEICDQEQYTEIPALGHDYESVVMSPASGVYSYTTYTCIRCNDSYIDNVTVPGSIANGICGDTLFWAVTENGILHIFGEGEMENYEIAEAPWFQYEQLFQNAVIHKGVTSIGVYAFYNHTRLKGVEIQDGVTTIGERAFYLCEGLTNVEISDSTATIGDYAFYQCVSLTNLEIPASVTTIGERPFWNCKKLESIHVNKDNCDFSSDGRGVLFNKQQNILIHAPQAISGVYTIPDNVTEIGSYAFAECNSLTSVSIPDSVTVIGEQAFRLCSSLREFRVNENNPNFSNDSYGVLFDKQQTFLIKAPTTISGAYAIPDSVTRIGDLAFYNCRSLNSIVIPGSVVTVGGAAFEFCENLQTVDIQPGVKEIGGFSFCSNLTILDIPEGVTSIGDFAYCVNLKSVSIPGSVTEFADFAFQNCESLTTVEIADGVTEIGRYAFSNCGNLTSVVIPSSITTIANDAFNWCTELVSVQILDGVTTIDEWAFGNCSALPAVEIPASVTVIEASAFAWCTDLSEITFVGNAPNFGDYSFRNVNATAYYPANDPTWTEDMRQSYGGTITWVAYMPECTDHSYETVVMDPTCTEPGYTTYTCSKCGDSYVADEIATTGHVEGEAVCENEVAATCTSDGSYESVVYCTACDVEISRETVTTPTVEHSYEVVVTAPTCTEPGFTTYHCSVCGETYVADEVDPAGHDYVDGICTRCGEVEPTEPEEEPITITSQPVDYIGLVGDTATFTVVAEGEGLKYQWYCSTDGGANWGTTGVTEDTLSVVFLAYRNNQLYRCVITDVDGNTVTTDAAALKAKEITLEITRQPESYVGSVGDEVTFALAANGNGLTYEWFISSDGGATWAKSYMTGYMSDTQIAVLRAYRDGYKLYCKVSDVFGDAVNSDIVSMTVKSSEVTINSQPQTVNNAAILQMYTFTVDAEGDNLTYLWEVSTNGGETWEQSWSDGYNTDTLNIRMYQYRDGYQYRCVVTSGLKTVVVTDAALLNLQAPSVTIESSPESVYALVYEDVTMHVEANGTDLTYQWYYSTDGGATWVENWMTGYSTDTLNFVAIPSRVALYMCKVTDGSGTSVWSEPAQMKILSSELGITSQPENFVGTVGGTASFIVSAEGEAVQYRWYLSSDGGTSWSECWFDGYDTNTLSFYINASRAANLYKCVITDIAGNTITSNTVSVVIE